MSVVVQVGYAVGIDEEEDPVANRHKHGDSCHIGEYHVFVIVSVLSFVYMGSIRDRPVSHRDPGGQRVIAFVVQYGVVRRGRSDQRQNQRKHLLFSACRPSPSSVLRTSTRTSEPSATTVDRYGAPSTLRYVSRVAIRAPSGDHDACVPTATVRRLVPSASITCTGGL